LAANVACAATKGSSFATALINLDDGHVQDCVRVADVLALAEQIVVTIFCVVFAIALVSIRLANIRVNLPSLTLHATLLSAIRASEIVVIVTHLSCVSFIAAESVQMLPLAQTIVVVYHNFVFSCGSIFANLDLVLVSNARTDVSQGALSQVVLGTIK